MGESLTLFDAGSATGKRPAMSPLVRRALKAADLSPADEAAKQLAVRLAADLDSIPLGGKGANAAAAALLATLKDLGMTPRARRLASMDEPETAGGVDPLDQLSSIRAARRDAAAVAGS